MLKPVAHLLTTASLLLACQSAPSSPEKEPTLPFYPCRGNSYTIPVAELPTSFQTNTDPDAQCSFTLGKLGLLLHGEEFYLATKRNNLLNIIDHVDVPSPDQSVTLAHGGTTIVIKDEWGLDVTIEVSQKDLDIDIPDGSTSGN